MVQSIGFVGLGIMGQPMALNLAKAGYKLTVYNRTPAKAEPLEKAGARVVASPAEAAREADVVIVIVSDNAAVEQVVSGKDGVLDTIRSGVVLIDSSTVSPVVSRKLACHVSGKGARMLDAPVTGSKHGAEKGELTFMIGGEREALDRVMDVLRVMGRKHIYCGENGKGLAAKLSMNAILATTVAIFAEGFVAATKAGVSPQVLLEIMQSSLARSAIVDFKAPFVFRGDFVPYFPLKLMHKDLELAMEAAYAQNFPMPVTSAVKEVYAAARAQGKGEMDYAGVIAYFEEMAGVQVRA